MEAVHRCTASLFYGATFMAVYVVGDLHGALEEFQSLLYKIHFRYDGSDSLYLLGDYADWGEKSIETLQYVKKISEACPQIHPLMGNHEWMFLTTVLSSDDENAFSRSAENWLIRNRGLVTWKGFCRLEDTEKEELIRWMQRLPFKEEITVNGKLYMLTHAYPLFDGEKAGDEEQDHRKIDALWRRLMLHEDPFAGYTGEKRYDCFICGHTPTSYYYEQLRGDRSWPGRKPAESKRNRIFFGEKFVDIDCGAKCFGMTGDRDGIWTDRPDLRAQLAALRLDDGKEFYVYHPSLPGMTAEELKKFELPLPNISLPQLPVPQLSWPEWKLPEVQLPELRLPRQLSFIWDNEENADDWAGTDGEERKTEDGSSKPLRETLRREEDGEGTQNKNDDE